MASVLGAEVAQDKEPLPIRAKEPLVLTSRSRSEPLHAQLYRALRAAILRGELGPGARLPSTRALAADEGLARNTVLRAYDQLLGEGYVVGRRGSATRVAAEIPDDVAEIARAAHRRRRARRPGAPRLSRWGARLPDAPPSWASRERALRWDFRYGRPSFSDFPHATWARILARRARAATVRDLDYGDPAGLPELRAAIADYLGRARAVDCRPEQVVVVHGTQQGLDLVARVLLDPGDRVLIEEPHYSGARRILEAAGARLVAVPVDRDGFDVGRAGRAGARARLAYVTPSHQFPTGVVMTLPRRLALLAWAERAGAWVVEDDYDSEYRYGGRPIESLQGLDRAGRVIYLGTFSKVLFPALRLGYLVLPPELVGPCTTAKALADTGSPGLEQRALADFLGGGHFERYLRRTRARNRERRATLLAAVTEHFGDRVEVAGANAGLHLLVWLRGVPAAAAPRLVTRAARQGVGVYTPDHFYLGRPPGAGLVLGYASLDEGAIREGVRRLARALGPRSL
jgi:GntR family transcriptional regulator/MocR family aminotransferase